jgi:hypothetical protein
MTHLIIVALLLAMAMSLLMAVVGFIFFLIFRATTESERFSSIATTSHRTVVLDYETDSNVANGLATFAAPRNITSRTSARIRRIAEPA